MPGIAKSHLTVGTRGLSISGRADIQTRDIACREEREIHRSDAGRHLHQQVATPAVGGIVHAVTPVCVHVMTLTVEVGEVTEVSDPLRGARRVRPFVGGTFEIHATRGTTFECAASSGVVTAGLESTQRRSPTLTELEAHITLRTDGGDTIYVRAQGRRFARPDVLERLLAGEAVSRREYYGCSATVMETAAPGLEWMTYHQFIGNATGATVRYYAVDYPEVRGGGGEESPP